MSLPEKLRATAAELENASQREDFNGASVCAARYMELLQKAAGDLPPAEMARHVTEASQSVEAARRKICVARARIADRLRKLRGSVNYRASVQTPTHTWSVPA